MIFLASPGCTSWILELRCSQPISLLPLWFALSLILPFVFFVLTLLASICLALFVSFFWSRVLFLNTLAPVLTLRMVLLSVSIVTCLRLLGPYCWSPLLLLSSGLKLFLQRSTS